MKVKVKQAFLQTSIVIPRSEILGLDSLHTSSDKMKGIEMEFSPDIGLIIKTPMLTRDGSCAIIPETNCKVLICDLLEEKAKK